VSRGIGHPREPPASAPRRHCGKLQQPVEFRRAGRAAISSRGDLHLPRHTRFGEDLDDGRLARPKVACDSLVGREFEADWGPHGRGSSSTRSSGARPRERDDASKEQQRPALQLGALAAPYRFRVIADAEAFQSFPVVYGRTAWYCDGVNCWSCPLPRQVALTAHSDRPRLAQKLRATPGVH
jgi:hypothetical protein